MPYKRETGVKGGEPPIENTLNLATLNRRPRAIRVQHRKNDISIQIIIVNSHSIVSC
jgi:hypothetical protein